MDQIAQNATLAQWTVETPIPDYWSPEHLGKPAPVADIFALLEQLKNGRGPQEILAGHAQHDDVSEGYPCVPRKILAGHPCGPSNQLTRLARISIHDKLLLAHYFTKMLGSRQAKSQLALARDYGVSGAWMRSICVMTWLAPEIQESIGRMSAEEAGRRVRFRELFNIAEVRNHDEQLRRFAEMVGSER